MLQIYIFVCPTATQFAFFDAKVWQIKKIGITLELYFAKLISTNNHNKCKYQRILFNSFAYYLYNCHCVKSVRIRSYSGPQFPRIFPHTDWRRRDTEYPPYSVRMRENAGKMRTGITPNTASFYAVCVIKTPFQKLYNFYLLYFSMASTHNKSQWRNLVKTWAGAF